MPDSLFYLLIIAVVAFYLTGVTRRRRALMDGLPGAVQGVRRGPVPGYAFMPGSALRFDPRESLQAGGGTWEAVSLETLHAGMRSRVVLNLRTTAPLDDKEAFTLMKTMAKRVAHRTEAQVVAVRLEAPDGEADGVLVYATDGRGWTGTTRDAEITADLPGRDAFRLTK